MQRSLSVPALIFSPAILLCSERLILLVPIALKAKNAFSRSLK